LHQGGAPENVFDPKMDKAISNQDLPQNFVLSYIYELPFGKGKRFLNSGGVADRVVGGWSISGVQRYESGQPLAFGCATGVPAYADCIRFDSVSGQSIYSSEWSSKSGNFNPVSGISGGVVNQSSMFNPAAFSDPNSLANLTARGTYAFGDTPRVYSSIRMSPYLSEDFNLLKSTKITESKEVLLEVSILNAFNRHVWNRPEDLEPNDPINSFGVIQYDNFSQTGGGSYLLFPRRLQLQLKFKY